MLDVSLPWMPPGEVSTGLNNRMPYWLSAGRETAEGQIVFSQPEVVLYDRASFKSGTNGPGYPDFIEDGAGPGPPGVVKRP